MPEKILIENCSPTLAGVKTGSLFRVRYEDEETIREDIRQMNRMFIAKGLRAVPMRFTGTHVLLYIYRPAFLKQDLSRARTREILLELGYSCSHPEEDVARLARKVKQSAAFPHEIGFFLGYPPEDVIGFMEHRDEGVKCAGLWKVYGDEKEANRLFDLYRKCTRIYHTLWERGRSIDQLTVKV